MKRITIFCENATMETKARIIVVAFSLITIFLSIVAFVFLDFIKSDIDRLFEKRTASIAKLHILKDLFSTNISDTIVNLNEENISQPEALSVLKKASYLIQYRWEEYKLVETEKEDSPRRQFVYFVASKYFSSTKMVNFHIDDMEHTQSVDREINELLKQIDKYTLGDRYGNGKNIIIKANDVSSRLSQLIDLNLQCAFIEKQQTDAIYSIGFKIIISIFFLGLLVTIISSIVIPRSVAIQNKTLEDLVEQKTLELQKMNEDLENRVAIQVAEGRKKDALLQSQAKLAAMGEVIANIAHQWRQPLNALTTIIQSFKLQKIAGTLDDNFVNEQVDAGIHIASKMSNTIQDFRNFFKPEYKQKPFLVSESINKAITFFETYTEKKDTKIVRSFIGDGFALGYEGSFTQVLLNIINNSNDAIGSTRKDGSGLIVIKVRKLSSSGLFSISFFDNGGGFDSLILDRIFEPYFTTKHQNVGTGLGLYMAKRVVENYMDGRIEAKNIKFNGASWAYLRIILKIAEQ